MTNEELKEALLTRRPVTARIAGWGHVGFSDISFACVSAIIYRRKDDGSIYIQAELMIEGINSATIVDARAISFLDQ